MAKRPLFVTQGTLSLVPLGGLQQYQLKSFLMFRETEIFLKCCLPQPQKCPGNTVGLTHTVPPPRPPDCPHQLNAIPPCRWIVPNIGESSMMFHLLLPPSLSGNCQFYHQISSVSCHHFHCHHTCHHYWCLSPLFCARNTVALPQFPLLHPLQSAHTSSSSLMLR